VVGLEVPILRKAADTLTEVVFRMNCDESDHFIIAVCVAFVGAEGRDTASLARLGVGCGRTASAVIVLCHAVFHTHAAFEFVAVAEVVVAIVTAIFFTAAAAAATAAAAVGLAVGLVLFALLALDLTMVWLLRRRVTVMWLLLRLLRMCHLLMWLLVFASSMMLFDVAGFVLRCNFVYDLGLVYD